MKTGIIQAHSRAMTAEMAEDLAGCYPRLERHLVLKVFEALASTGASVPIVRVVAIVDMLDRYQANDPDDYFGSMRSAGFLLSVVSDDATHRLHDERLKALHDKIVEMFMPSRARPVAKLQALLNDELGVQLATFGECGCCIVATSDLDHFDAEFGPEEALRTYLDCESFTASVESGQLVSMGRYSERERQQVEIIFRLAADLAKRAPVPMAHVSVATEQRELAAA